MRLDKVCFVAHVVPMNTEPNTERIVAHMSKSLVRALDDIQHRERIFGRAEVIRLLVEAAIEEGLDSYLGGKSHKTTRK